MILVESVLGNVNHPSWQALLEGADLDVLRLDQWQAQKNRFRRKTEGGTELALSLERNTHLHDGDLLLWDPEARRGVVARIVLQEVMVIRLDDLLSKDPAMVVRSCVELGHALGNQHWPAVVKGNAVYVPLTVDRKVMASVMRTHAFEGISYEFLPGAEVIPYLAPHEARRLFGGADSTPHSHVHGDGPSHDHDHPHHHHHH
ncbi:urease accessory protein UreE [Tautonia marina]|uniref:urease accessory protein UreE n=1 Tax=Tautonia marina TaxID=2653855 RepID=UPI001260FD19|nr:urease accessory protein UreE [Tautonia marina]